MKNYISLIIDIENSRRYNVDDRNTMQEFMIDCMEQLNDVFERSLQFKLTFSAGDELQGLFRDLTGAILYLRIFEMMIHPVKLRAGIGVGEWNIKVKDGTSTQQDGPAYHRARQAIEEVRKKQTQRYRIHTNGNDDFINNLINASFSLKGQQGYMQNIALIIMELLYPFQKNDLIVYDHEAVRKLLNMKYEYRIGERRLISIASERKREAEHLNEELLNVVKPIYIDGNNFDAEEEIVKKNMSSQIAAALGSKRQNADMLIRRGNSVIIRNMDYVALQYIEKEYKKYDI